MASPSIPRCAGPGCRQQLPPPAPTGRPRRYCSAKCRQAALRVRTTPAAQDLQAFDPANLVPVVTADVDQIREQTAAVDALLDRRPPADPDSRVEHAVLQAKALSFELNRLGQIARPEFAWRCSKLAESINAGLRRYFKEA